MHAHLWHVACVAGTGVFAWVEQIVMVVHVEIASRLIIFKGDLSLLCGTNFFDLSQACLDGLSHVDLGFLGHSNGPLLTITALDL
jgi:hypothetical protein